MDKATYIFYKIAQSTPPSYNIMQDAHLPEINKIMKDYGNDKFLNTAYKDLHPREVYIHSQVNGDASYGPKKVGPYGSYEYQKMMDAAGPKQLSNAEWGNKYLKPHEAKFWGYTEDVAKATGNATKFVPGTAEALATTTGSKVLNIAKKIGKGALGVGASMAANMLIPSDAAAAPTSEGYRMSAPVNTIDGVSKNISNAVKGTSNVSTAIQNSRKILR